MTTVNNSNFGFLIAYLIPGFIVALGVSLHSQQVANWLSIESAHLPSIAGLLFGTLAAIFFGLLASTIRWLILDSIHHATGVSIIVWKLENLSDRHEAFQMLVEVHYRYYQFYGNSLVAVLLSTAFASAAGQATVSRVVAAIVVVVLFFAASRDSLRKYYERADRLFSVT